MLRITLRVGFALCMVMLNVSSVNGDVSPDPLFVFSQCLDLRNTTMQHGQFSLMVQYHRNVINSLSKLTDSKIVFWLSNRMLRVDYRSQDESGAWSEWTATRSIRIVTRGSQGESVKESRHRSKSSRLLRMLLLDNSPYSIQHGSEWEQTMSQPFI